MSNKVTANIKRKYGSVKRYAELNGWEPNFVSLVTGRFLGKQEKGKSGEVISRLKAEGLWVEETE